MSGAGDKGDGHVVATGLFSRISEPESNSKPDPDPGSNSNLKRHRLVWCDCQNVHACNGIVLFNVKENAMSTELEIRERQKVYLRGLLDIKKSNPGVEIKELSRVISSVIVAMSQEDVAWVEKIVGIKAME